MDVTDYPDHLFYDMNNQIRYEPLADGTVRTGFTPWAASLMGEVLVFTPKRIGREFEKERSFAVRPLRQFQQSPGHRPCGALGDLCQAIEMTRLQWLREHPVVLRIRFSNAVSGSSGLGS